MSFKLAGVIWNDYGILASNLTPLEALERLRNRDFPLMITTLPPTSATKEGYSEKDLFDNIEKSLKAFEIIKEKKVNVHYLVYSNDLKDYNERTFILPNEILTQEEYDLLKEALS